MAVLYCKTLILGGNFYLAVKATGNCVYETLCPNHLLVHKDAALFLDNDHLQFEASRYTTHHPASADQI